jgi:glutamyl-tRNA synthetase
MNDQAIVTRFPPSPTGLLHIGGARTALFNWAFARHHGGRFILRMEDTDRARSSPEAARQIIADLRWLGIDWDEGPEMPQTEHEALDRLGYDPLNQQTGERGPYWQSQRVDLYNEHIERLLSAGLAETDSESPNLVRFRMPRREIVFDDAVRGRITTAADQVDDFIIRKSDGFPTYHLAVVVDDALMGITHVIRGQDHLSNTAKHWALQEALGLDHPTYAHMSLTTNADGSKMGKRDKAKVARAAARQKIEGGETAEDQLIETLLGTETRLNLLRMPWHEDRELTGDDIRAFLNKENDDVQIANLIAAELNIHLPEVNVSDFRASGYLPGVMVNFLGLLGWNPGNNVERFDPDPLTFLCEHFDLARLVKGNATFDRQKLLRFNHEAIGALSLEQFVAQLRRFLDITGRHPRFAEMSDDHFRRFAEAYQPRAHTLVEPFELGRFFVQSADLIEYDQKAVRKVLEKNEGEGYTMLGVTRELLDQLTDWQANPIEALVKQVSEQRGVGMGKVAQPLRVAVTGTTVSPPIGLTLEILGREETIKRINICLALAQPQRSNP